MKGIWLENPTDYPITVYSADFDEAYKTEEEMLTVYKEYHKDFKMCEFPVRKVHYVPVGALKDGNGSAENSQQTGAVAAAGGGGANGEATWPEISETWSKEQKRKEHETLRMARKRERDAEFKAASEEAGKSVTELKEELRTKVRNYWYNKFLEFAGTDCLFTSVLKILKIPIFFK